MPSGAFFFIEALVNFLPSLTSGREMLRRFVDDESAQDLVEYGLLTLFIGLAGIAAFGAMSNTIGTWYGSSNTGVNSLWESPDPGGS